jgi:DnaK suppressor protein
MNKKEQKELKEALENMKSEIMAQAAHSRQEGLGLDPNDLPDEVDLASSETDQSLNLHLRDRERILLLKVEKSLESMDEGTYGECTVCGEEIGFKRLKARPVTDLCIRCKEEQERVEKGYAE